MKKIKLLLPFFSMLFVLVLGTVQLSAQTPAYSCEIRNGSFSAANMFEFDIYLTQVGSAQFEMAAFNTGILLNAGFVNGGTIVPSLIGGSEFLASQVPTQVAYDAGFRCVKLAPQKPPRVYATGITSGTIISNTTGTKVCRMRLTNSVNFGADPLNYSWSMNLQPYHTVVAAFVPNSPNPKVGTIITNSASQSVSNSLTLYLEGLYTTGTGNRKAQDSGGDHFAGPVADLVTVKLASATSPYGIVYTANNVQLYANGKSSFSIPGSLTGSYYIVVKHRNSIETWSAAPVSFAGGAVSYNFSTSLSQAFGSNLKAVGGGFYAMFGGDISQDGLVDGTDMASVDNASTAGVVGYVATDANGDGLVDGSDMALIDNNSTASVASEKP